MMHDLAFPMGALALTLLILIPALTLLSRAWLARTRAGTVNWADFGGNQTLAALTLPTLIPLVWLTSATLHELELEQVAANCLLGHADASACIDALLLIALLFLGVVMSVAPRAYRERPRLSLKLASENSTVSRRVRGIQNACPTLANLTLLLAHDAPAAAFTMGWFRRRIVLHTAFAEASDDATLRAVLLHEWSHLSKRDTLLHFIARVCLHLNIAGALLRPDFNRWSAAREAHCDRDAVDAGGDALALAQGIMRALRFGDRCPTLGHARLTGPEATHLKLRVSLLLCGGNRNSNPRQTRTHLACGLALLVVVWTPHMGGQGLLGALHQAIERLVG